LVVLWALALRIWHGSIELNAGRFWDERFGLQNIAKLLGEHSLWPANAFHPTFSYIPHAVLLAIVEALHRLTGSSRLELLVADQFTPLGYFLCRLLQAVLGAASIVWLARVGRRVFDRPTGLIAGLLLAATPWHIRQSVIYKPDMLLLLLGIVAIDLAITAVLLPRRRTFLAAGVAVGLGLATKFNAAPIAVPLTVGTLLRRSQRGRRLLLLILAGIVAAAIFVALDPHLFLRPGMLRKDFVAGTLNDYAHKGAGTSRWGIVAHAGSSLLSATFHGPWVGMVALAGYCWLLVVMLRSSERRRAVLATTLVYPAAYVLIYAVITTNPSAHNWLVLLPITSLAAAALLVRAALWLAGWSPVAAKIAVPAGLAVLLVVTVVPATRYVYRNTVPTTWEAAAAVIRVEAADSPQLLILRHGGDLRQARPLGPGDSRAVVVPARQWTALGLPSEGADVEVFDSADTAPPVLAGAQRLRKVEPALFRAHGRTLLLSFHPWKVSSPPRNLRPHDGCFMPPLVDGDRLVSFEVALGRLDAGEPRLRWGDRAVPLFWGGRTRTAQRWVSPRLAPSAAESLLCIAGTKRPVRRVTAWIWDRGATLE